MMRDNPQSKDGKIKAKDSLIFWNKEPDRVTVIDIHDKYKPKRSEFHYSGGAAWVKWREFCKKKDTAKIFCLQTFLNLVYRYDIDPEIVDNALSVIIEYQDAFRDKKAMECNI